MRTHKFKVGDVVRIRQWEDMEREFGTGCEELIRIDVDNAFVNDMRNLCGKVFTITDIYGYEVLGHGSDWNISTDMLEPFVKKVGQRYEVLVEGVSFKQGEIITLCRIDGDTISWYANVKDKWGLMYDIDHPCCEVKYIDEGIEVEKEDKDMKQEMNINDLVNGAVVELREGTKHLVLKGALVHGDVKDILLNLGNGGFLILDNYSTDGLHKSQSKFDIMKICQPEYIGNAYLAHVLKGNKNHWTWERSEVKEMTIEEISEKLGYEVKVVKGK